MATDGTIAKAGTFLSDMGIAKRLWLVFGLLLVLIAAQSGTGIFGLGGLNRRIDSVIALGIGRVADLVSEIAHATAEQASGLDEVNIAIAQMDEMTQKNAALVEESTATARSLEEQADQLRHQMTFFTLDRKSV